MSEERPSIEDFADIPLPPKPSKRWLFFDSLFHWASVVLVVGGGLYYVGHLVKNYVDLKRDFDEKSSRIVQPRIKDTDIVERGFIYAMDREMSIREKETTLIWWVVVPSSNTRYACSFDSGYANFRKGETVTLIHAKNLESGDYGYMIGVNEQDKDKATLVWTNDMETINLEN